MTPEAKARQHIDNQLAQDPSDEPARGLLERIRAEQGTSTKALTKKKRVGL